MGTLPISFVANLLIISYFNHPACLLWRSDGNRGRSNNQPTACCGTAVASLQQLSLHSETVTAMKCNLDKGVGDWAAASSMAAAPVVLV